MIYFKAIKQLCYDIILIRLGLHVICFPELVPFAGKWDLSLIVLFSNLTKQLFYIASLYPIWNIATYMKRDIYCLGPTNRFYTNEEKLKPNLVAHSIKYLPVTSWECIKMQIVCWRFNFFFFKFLSFMVFFIKTLVSTILFHISDQIVRCMLMGHQDH